jgi:hypothetical protein
MVFVRKCKYVACWDWPRYNFKSKPYSANVGTKADRRKRGGLPRHACVQAWAGFLANKKWRTSALVWDTMRSDTAMPMVLYPNVERNVLDAVATFVRHFFLENKLKVDDIGVLRRDAYYYNRVRALQYLYRQEVMAQELEGEPVVDICDCCGMLHTLSYVIHFNEDIDFISFVSDTGAQDDSDRNTHRGLYIDSEEHAASGSKAWARQISVPSLIVGRDCYNQFMCYGSYLTLLRGDDSNVAARFFTSYAVPVSRNERFDWTTEGGYRPDAPIPKGREPKWVHDPIGGYRYPTVFAIEMDDDDEEEEELPEGYQTPATSESPASPYDDDFRLDDSDGSDWSE